MLGYGDSVDVGDWFASFCIALGAQTNSDRSGRSSRAAAKGKGVARRRRKMKAVERDAGSGLAGTGGDVQDVDDVGEGGNKGTKV